MTVINETEARMDELRSWIADEDQRYQFAIARGDWSAVGSHKSKLARFRREFGQLLKLKMQQSL